MATNQLQSGGNLVTARGGTDNVQLMSQYRSAYGEQTANGKVFHGCGAIAGNSFPLYTATAFVFGLWNTSTEVDLELIKFSAGYVSGTGVAGPFGYNFKANAGLGVGVPVAAFNHVATGIKNGRIGAGLQSKASFTNAATNTVVAAAATDFIPGNMSELVTTAADATNVPFVMEEWFHGTIIIPPGCLIWPAALLASVSLFNMRLTWMEVPRGV